MNLISGTPYFKEQWLKGAVVSAANVSYKPTLLKLDLVDNHVHYLDADGKEMIATTPLKEVTLTDTLTNSSWRFVNSSLLPAFTGVKKWYVQLASGKASLYQHFTKLLSERIPYGSATTEQLISTKEDFFVLHNGILTHVKKAKDLVEILKDRKEVLEQFLKDNKHKSTVAELTAIVELYNKQL